ncbi:restriction endonuclease subunit S [Providencia rettgeri]|nr:restriction endonuclease subunit S [Providencia rettgeri]
MKLVKLKDITSKITKGTTPSKSDGGFSSIGVNYIKAESVSYEGRIDESKFAFITEAVHKKLKRSQLQENDILFSMAGAFLGKTGFVMKHHIPANTNQALALIRVKPEIAYPKFIHYYLQQKSVVHFVNNAVSQSAQPNINLQQIGDLDICLLSLAQQQRVVEILDAIDNKITLNHQINQTLEQMAQTLFKSWFVDFAPVIDNALDAGFFEKDLAFSEELLRRVEARKAVRESDGFNPLSVDIRQLFPDEFEECAEPVLGLGGWVPKGWEVKMLGEITDELRRGISPKYIEEGGVQVINQKCIRNHEISYELTRRHNQEIRSISGRELKLGDVLVNSTGVGTLGRIAQVTSLPETTVVDSHVTVVRASDEMCPIFTFGQLMISMEKNIERLGEGSTGQTELSRKILSEQLVILPLRNIADKAELSFKSFSEMQTANRNQNMELTKLRDTLLPKLISGELSLSDIKIDNPEETFI